MRVVFMGTPHIAATVLHEIAQHHDVVGVFTRPDAIRGRGKKLEPSPVKQEALLLGLPVYEYASLSSEEPLACLASLSPDVICVVAYSALLGEDVLSMPRFGCLNVHASLLPRWRGAAPIERAILAGDETTGVSIMRMEAGLDTGPYCAQVEIAIGEMSKDELEAEIAVKGADLLVSCLEQIEHGDPSWIKQDDSQACYANKIEKHELDLDPNDPAIDNARRVRASSDAHPCHAIVAGKDVTVLGACLAEDEQGSEITKDIAAGEALFRFKRLFMKCSDGSIEALSVKPQGKKEMSAQAFCAGIQGAKSATLKWEKVHV